MKHSFPAFASLFLLTALVLWGRTAAAAEIININTKYKIVFSDLTADEVKSGDLVTVKLASGKTVNLKVLETYPVMSKLTVPEGPLAPTDAEFASISVGDPVAPGLQKAAVVRQEAPRDSAGTPASVPALPAAPTPLLSKRDAAPALAAPAAAPGPAERTSIRASALEQRIDQLMASNLKLTDSVAQLLAEKNSAEDVAREKSSEVEALRVRTEELSAANARFASEAKRLESSLGALEKDRAAQQQEIDRLNSKIAELRKKLTKMAEIVDAKVKAYEKQ